MTDVLAQIEAVLQHVAERTTHSLECDTTYMRWRCDCGEKSPSENACNCDRGARVLQDQARTVERMLDAAKSEAYNLGQSPGRFTTMLDISNAIDAAALRATQETPT